jgi:hypothetical protein
MVGHDHLGRSLGQLLAHGIDFGLGLSAQGAAILVLT